MANIERLERVIRVLRKVPAKKFNLSIYYEREFKCGAVACAVGHAALNPWFRRRGFRLGPPEKDRDGVITRSPILAEKEDENAVAEFFDIPRDQIWKSPFYSGAYPNGRLVTKAQVIRRLRDFINEQSK